MIEVERTARSRAPRTVVWELLSDLRGWHTWGPWTSTELHGDVRTLVSERKRLTGKPYVMKERVTAIEPEERLEYDLLSGLPVRGYHAVVTLADAEAGGTEIRWRVRFRPAWPFLSALWRGTMTKVVAQVAEALARAADQRGGVTA